MNITIRDPKFKVGDRIKFGDEYMTVVDPPSTTVRVSADGVIWVNTWSYHIRYEDDGTIDTYLETPELELAI